MLSRPGLLTLVFIFLFSQVNSTPLIRSVAITDFTANGFDETQSWIGSSCADVLIQHISADKTIRIVERSQLSRIIEEMKLQMGGLVNSEAAVETGNLIGVTYFITGSISKLEDQVILSSRIFSVETSEIISTGNVRGSLKDLFMLQEQLADKICSDLNIKILINSSPGDALNSFEDYQKMEYLKKMSGTLPKFSLDPRRKIRINEYLNSVQTCDELLSQNPENHMARYYKGIFLMHLEEFDKAEKETDLAVRSAPGKFEPALLKSMILYNSGASDEAATNLRQVVADFPDQPEGWFLLSKIEANKNNAARATEFLIRSILGKYIIPQAISNLRSELGIDKRVTGDIENPSVSNVARLYLAFWSKEKEPADIQQIASKANAEFPGFYLPYYFLGRAEMKSKRFNEASNLFRECISCNPEFPEAHREVALCYFNLKLCSQAELHAKMYMQLSDAVTDYSLIEDARKKCNP